MTADTSAISDDDGLGAFSYQWNRDGVAISGATASNYSLVDADVGRAITLTVTYTDGNSTVETLTSAATSAVVNVNDTPVGLPSISGTATEGQTLTADTSSISDDDGLAHSRINGTVTALRCDRAAPAAATALGTRTLAGRSPSPSPTPTATAPLKR